MIAAKIEALLAYRGYDADAIRQELANAEVEAVIPSKSNRYEPIPHDWVKYRWRNLVERLFNKLKNWRRIATRYDKTKEYYLGFVNLSPATQRSYLHAVTKFSRHFGRSPDRLGLEDVGAFQVYLVSQGIFWPSLNQTVCALHFFLWGDVEPGRDTRADRLCAHASQAARDIESR